MRLCIDDAEHHPTVATFSEKSYGKHSQTRKVPFSLEVNADEFLSRFATVYEECIADLRRDDVVTGQFHPPYPGATDYPSIAELFGVPASSRMAFLETYLVLDILRLVFKEDAEGNGVTWLVERCDSIDRFDGLIVIQGVMQALPRAA
jgi:hypothetical protein